MNIFENLRYLRKRDKITQEELADRLGVSRQSVSKWETGEAYPETDKLIALCDIFGVSLDALMRTDLTAEEVKEQPEPKIGDGAGFIKAVDRFSRAIAIGVFLILIGVSICVILAGYSFTLEGKSAELTAVMGGVAVLVFVAVAVFLFIWSGMNYDRFNKENPEVGQVYGDGEIKAFTKRFNLSMALLVSGILVAVVFLVVFTSLIGAGILAVGAEDSATCYVVSTFLFALAFLVGGLVYMGIQHTKYDVAEYNRTFKKNFTSRHSKLREAICSVIMLVATALFLVLGFVGGWWHPGWVVFPVGGIICGIITKIMDAKDDD